MIANRTHPVPATPRRWSLADDYLADPAVAPMRALLAALVRRMHRGRRSAPPAGRTLADTPRRSPAA